jgi:5-formyltetrahydrofolate cyclo-ligase
MDGHESRRLRRLHFTFDLTFNARPMPLASTQAAKIELRRSALAARNTVFAARGAAAGEALAAKVLQSLPSSAGKIIAGYWPIGSEIDLRPAMSGLHARGALMCMPIAGQRGDRLVFRRWAPGDRLEQGPFGTFHPSASAAALEPDVLLVPLLAFDSMGQRLGYGAGYYDRTLSTLRAAKPMSAWGIAFDEQETPHVPAEPTDAKLDGVITDKRLLLFAIPR